MAVSVKIREDTKRRIEKLGADVASKTGKDLSFQDLVEALVQYAESEPTFVISAGSRVRFPLSAAAKRRILSRAWDWGFPTSEEDIDRELYSAEAIHGARRSPPRARK